MPYKDPATQAAAQMQWDREHPARVKELSARYRASGKGLATSARKELKRNLGVFMVACRKAVPCADCGGRFPAECMDFDHRPGVLKKACIGQMANACRWRQVFAEMEKCDLVCANCHRIRTFDRRHGFA